MKISRILMSLAAVAMLAVSCSEDDGATSGEGGLVISANPSFILCDGNDATTITVMYAGKNVTKSAQIYVGNDATPMATNEFTTTEAGVYEFLASYEVDGQTVTTAAKATVSAVVTIPDAPVDSNPSSVNFAHRVLATQFTGTSCSACPYMIAALIESQEALADKWVLASVHVNIPAKDAFANESSTAFANYMMVNSAPSLGVNMHRGELSGIYGNLDTDKRIVQSLVNGEHSATTPYAGVAVAVDEVDGQIVARVDVKAATKKKFRVAAWLMEDGLKASQTGSNSVPGYDMSTHNNVVREFRGRPSNANFSGDDLGTLSKGDVETTVYSFDAEANGYNVDNCHVVAMVLTQNDKGAWIVNNAIDCAVGESVGYAYK